MKKLIIFIFLLNSCSLNTNSSYWNETLDSNYEELEFAKDYTFEEYGKILENYSNKKKIQKLN